MHTVAVSCLFSHGTVQCSLLFVTFNMDTGILSVGYDRL